MKKFVAVLFLSVISLAVWSQTADGIISKYFESIGGAAKWKSLKSMRLVGTIPTPQGEFAFEMLRKSPDKFLISLEVMGQKMVPSAYDGQVAWNLIPFTGDTIPKKMPEDQSAAIKLQAEFGDPLMDYAEKGDVVTYEGNADVDGVKCQVIKLVKNQGKEDETIMIYHLDGETYLPLLVKQTMKSGQMAGQVVDVYYSDYQDAGEGMLMPFTIEQKSGGQTLQSVKFTAIEMNKEISDDVFKYKGI